jgi:hypothetical protein
MEWCLCGAAWRSEWRREPRGETSELAFDRLFAVFELGLERPRLSSPADWDFEEAGGGAHYQAGLLSQGLRTVEIFALIHQPILLLSRVALGALDFRDVSLS